uniref:KR domain-containing protein n=1 Tax=Leisingera sp. TaxID=1879318 RepID=UPI002B2649F0
FSVFTTGAAQVRTETLPCPEKAMIAGPAGVIPRELPGLTCATIDIELPVKPQARFAFRKPAAEADITPRLLEELMADPANTAAAWRGEKRYELAWRPQPLPEPQTPPFTDGGHYLITGGYGGIGLTIAEYLMRDYGARISLISREGLPPRDTWERCLRGHSPANRTARRIRAVLALETSGRGKVLALAADVCNSSELRSARERAEAAFGPVTGVIHGAGVIDDGPLLAKTEDQIARVLAPKVSGLRALDTVFPDGSLELMVLFSSSSAATRPAGQVDYIAANEFLNAWAKHRAGGRTRVMAVDWGVWSDTGMAADAMASRNGATAAGPREPCLQPLLQERGSDTAGNRIFTPRFAAADWLLDEHRTADGTALMPGTGYIEMAAEALAETGINTPFEIRDLYFMRPLVASGQQPQNVLAKIEANENGYELFVYSGCTKGYFLNCQAMLASAAVAERPVALNLQTIFTRCPEEQAPIDGRLRSAQEAHLRFGPRWHVLNRAALGNGEGLASLSLPDIAAQDGCLLHPGLLDLATGWAMGLIPCYDASALWVPVSYRLIRVFAPLTSSICSHVRLADAPDASSAAFDITLTDPDGAVLVRIEGFRMQRLAAGFDAAANREQADATAADLGLEPAAGTQPLSAEERRLQLNISNGIKAAEGGNALARALATGLPQVVVSSLDLPALIAQAGQTTAAAEDAQTFERPQLDTDYAAPSNPVEEELAGLFAGLLGVSQVGIDDSFFDLGGHSLIAVRLFAQIKRGFGVEFPLSVLFEAPSVAALAERIIGLTGGGVAVEPGTPAAAAGDNPQFTHLVQLHPGDGTGRRPFFLAAGMFGNVLNLRQLALLVGKDRPVYGLQAKGLVGNGAPHNRIGDAAQSCLDEIRRIQPDGPYLLGGFSGGGITAYEMAQQLKDQRQDTAALILLDTPLPVRPPLSRRDKALIKLAELRSKGAGYFGEWAKARIAWEFEKRRAAPIEPGARPDFNNRKIELAFRTAVETYALRPWSGPLTLFRPPLDRKWQVSGGNWVSAAREYVFDDNDWTRWAAQAEVAEVPGDHDSMVLVPNVSVLAAGIKARLDAADAAAARPRFAAAAE